MSTTDNIKSAYNQFSVWNDEYERNDGIDEFINTGGSITEIVVELIVSWN